jgi:hypothetical protein
MKGIVFTEFLEMVEIRREALGEGAQRCERFILTRS